ncbi:MAG TPA: glycosyltransferase family 4 protein, partial [Polyangiales bacterium]
MRILMTSDTVGGVFSYASTLIRELGARGIETVLATMGRPLSDSQRGVLREIPNLEVHESAWALEWMDDPWDDVRATGDWLERLARDVAPDCIHLNHFAHGALAWPAPVLMVGHSCVASWWRAVHREAPPAKYDRYRRAVQAGLQAADRVIAPSRAMLRCMEELYGPFKHAAVIPNGIDVSAHSPKFKAPRVLVAGRLWDAAKNISALQRIAPRLSWPV